MQKEAFPEVPLSDCKQKLLGNGSAINPLSWESFMAVKKMEIWHQDGPVQTKLTPSVSPIYLPSQSSTPFSFSHHFSTSLLFFCEDAI